MGHLATADASGVPHVVPVCFAFVDGEFWIPIDEKPKTTARLTRLRNVEANSRVSLVFDHYEEDWSKLAYLLVRGNGEILDSPPEAAVTAWRARYEQYAAMRLEGRPAIKITPTSVSAWGDL